MRRRWSVEEDEHVVLRWGYLMCVRRANGGASCAWNPEKLVAA
jgi:hypothetical protein